MNNKEQKPAGLLLHIRGEKLTPQEHAIMTENFAYWESRPLSRDLQRTQHVTIGFLRWIAREKTVVILPRGLNEQLALLQEAVPQNKKMLSLQESGLEEVPITKKNTNNN